MNGLDIIEKLAEDNYLTAEQVESIGRHVSEIIAAVDQHPEILKEAGIAPNMKDVFLQHVLPMTGAGVLGALSLRGIDTLINKVKEHTVGEHRKEEAFNNMLNAHPDLSERDPGKLRTHFDSLYHFSPTYATDPLMAGEYVRQTMDTQGINPNMPLTAANVHRALTSPGKKNLEDYLQMPKSSLGRSEKPEQ
jgi:hypothetical protein